MCIAFRTGHPAGQTGKGTSLKQTHNEGMKDKLDVCVRERKCNKAVSVTEEEIIITDSKFHTTSKSEALCSQESTLLFLFFFWQRKDALVIKVLKLCATSHWGTTVSLCVLPR